MRAKWKKQIGVAAAAALVVAGGAGLASSAELVTAEVTGTVNDVTVTQGTTTNATINLSASGSISCAITSANASTATVDTSFSYSSAGVLTASTPSAAKSFYSNGVPSGGGTNCGVTWVGAPTAYGVTASFSAAATTPVGDYTITLSEGAGTTATTDPSVSGGHLDDGTATTITVHVVAPVVTNHAPTVLSAAADANGNEGDTLQTSGSFTDSDGDALSLSVPSGTPGNFVDNGNGTWTWSLATTDQTSGSVTVTANDGHGGTVTDTFNYAAVNVAPSDPGTPALTTGSSPNNDGLFTLGWTASTDVSGDTVTYTLQHRDADDSDWSDVATSLATNSYSFTGSGEAEGTWTYRVQASDEDGGVSNWSGTSDPVVVDESNPNAPTLTAPTPDYTDGSGNNWYAAAVDVTVTDNGDPDLADTSAGSGVDPTSFTSPINAAAEGANPLSATVKDYAGNESSATNLTVYVDTTAPSVTLTCPASTLTLGSSVSAAWTASDGSGSGISGASSGSVSVPTNSVGSHTVSVAAGTVSDNVGHSSAASNTCTYSVVYAWTGFFAPVDNLPTWNSAKAGQAIPVKFNLGGNQGLNIFTSGYPKITQTACPNSATPDPIETYVTVNAGGSSLTYDTTAQQYVYVWKTDKTWASKCFTFDLGLNDGSTRQFKVQFTK